MKYSSTTPEQEALETVLGLIYEIVGAPKDAPYGDLPGYVREALKGKPEIPEGWVRLLRDIRRTMVCYGHAKEDHYVNRIDALLAAAPTVEEKDRCTYPNCKCGGPHQLVEECPKEKGNG